MSPINDKKPCSSCGLTKALGEFYFRKDSGGYTSACRLCRSKYTAVRKEQTVPEIRISNDELRAIGERVRNQLIELDRLDAELAKAIKHRHPGPGPRKGQAISPAEAASLGVTAPVGGRQESVSKGQFDSGAQHDSPGFIAWQNRSAADSPDSQATTRSQGHVHKGGSTTRVVTAAEDTSFERGVLGFGNKEQMDANVAALRKSQAERSTSSDTVPGIIAKAREDRKNRRPNGSTL